MHCVNYNLEPFRIRADIVVTASNVNYPIYQVTQHEIIKIESVVLTQITGTGDLTLVLRTSEQGIVTALHTAITALASGGKHYAEVFWLRPPAILMAGLLSTVADDKVRVTLDGYRYYYQPMA